MEKENSMSDTHSIGNTARPDPFAAVHAAIQQHEAELRALPHVLPTSEGIRAGYRYQNGWPTQDPAIIVTVLPDPQTGRVPADLNPPAQIGGIPIDIALATPLQQMQANPTYTALASQILAKNSGALPDLGKAAGT